MTRQDVAATVYAPETALLILQTHGINIGLSASANVYVYPLAHVFPVNTFLEDSIRYFLARGTAATERRIGFQMQNGSGEFFFLLLNLSDWQETVAADIHQQLNELVKQNKNDEIIDDNQRVKQILTNSALAEKFRHLYGKAEALALGIESDQGLVDKLTPLITRAYALEIPLNFLPAEHSAFRDVHVVQDALTLLRTGEVRRDIPSIDIFNTHRDICKRALQVHEANLQASEKALRNLNHYTQRFDRVITQTLPLIAIPIDG
ncbi:MAG: hypothetical protein COB66_06155 [Coxiella sp. (in: Bacteria)]|nr:MAG: hypothetical protein COB66_06155 [Coxiella sp. (in: g-proteobacteria)]